MKPYWDDVVAHVVRRAERCWLEMIDDRNRTVHTYDQAFAAQLAARIRERYVPLFRALGERLSR